MPYTLLNIRSVWAPVGYGLETTRKDWQGTNTSAISARLMAIARLNAGNASGYWKKIATRSIFIRLILRECQQD
jgi:hypothetical protein